MMNNEHLPRLKNAAVEQHRNLIEQQTTAFLAKGGEVKVVPIGASSIQILPEFVINPKAEYQVNKREAKLKK